MGYSDSDSASESEIIDDFNITVYVVRHDYGRLKHISLTKAEMWDYMAGLVETEEDFDCYWGVAVKLGRPLNNQTVTVADILKRAK